jgi:Tfp pilus assembly major pilin PilA
MNEMSKMCQTSKLLKVKSVYNIESRHGMSLKNKLSRWAGPTRKKALVQGFSLVELAIATAIATVIIVSGMAYYKQQLQKDTARALAEQYKTVNSAVGTYMVNHWPDLVALDQECGNTTWLVGTATLPLPSTINCSKTLGGTAIANALQPTIVDLVNLGYLQQGQAGPLLQPDDTQVFRPDGALAPHTFGVSIEVLCTNTASPTTDLTLCPDVTRRRDLRSVVFNTRPYANIDNRLFSILGEALSALPNDAGMSIPLGANTVPLNLIGRAKPGAVDTVVNNNFVDIPNPVRVSTDIPPKPVGPRVGQAGILGVRGGYGSSGFQKFTRRDGSAPPEAPWNFNNQNLTGVNQFDATDITAKSSLAIPAKRIGGNCDPAKESIAWQTGNINRPPDLLVCRTFFPFNASTPPKWERPKSTGIDPTLFTTLSINLPSGSRTISTGLSASTWGQPSIVGISQGETDEEVTILDEYCRKIDVVQNNNGSPFIAVDDYYECRLIGLNTRTWPFKKAVPLDFNLSVNGGGEWVITYRNPGTVNQVLNINFYLIITN